MYTPENGMQKYQYANIFPAFLTLLLFSCSNHSPAPVVDISYPNSNKSKEVNSDQHNNNQQRNNAQISETYLVKPGDTLFSIAWRFSLDFKALAKANQLKAYRIYPGQELSLNVEDDEPVFSSELLLAAINEEILHKSHSKSPAIERSDVKKSGSKQAYSKSSQPQRKSASDRTSKKSSSKSSRLKSSHSNRSSKVAKAGTIKNWIWPVNGKIINHFSSKTNQSKGVDIVAKLGEPVRATAKGRVVYSGNGLRGYGQLVIIKHNDNYLSAYAHNNKLHVEEDEFVKAGQRIADLGSSGSDREKLHFEIRYKGKPVDPLNYLPKSGVL